MLQFIEELLIGFGNAAWGTPLLVLLVGGGLFFLIYSRLLPYRYLGHAWDILRGKYDKPDEEGDISHYEALSTALAATVGLGNISGVAVAMTMGGPGALFWMWLSALIGVATKFFTCSLAIMYRGKDSLGETQGGPMYVITEGLGKKWKPLAVFFCIAGLFGPLPAFQANQLTQTIRDMLLLPNGIPESFMSKLLTGLAITAVVSLVIFGGIKRIGKVAGKLVPSMVAIYVLAVLYIIFTNLPAVPGCFALIFEDAFTGKAVLGGAVGAIILAGVRRAAFSNEAGIGTAPLAHGAAKTNEPIREGLIAMLGPIIDTILVCTMTALAIIITGSWDAKGLAFTGEGTWRDYEVESRVRIQDAHTQAGLTGRLTDAHNYYEFIIDNKGESAAVLNKVLKGQPLELARVPYPIEAGQNYQLTLSFAGDSIKAALNGQTVASVRDDSFTSGFAGLKARHGSVDFGAFRLSSGGQLLAGYDFSKSEQKAAWRFGYEANYWSVVPAEEETEEAGFLQFSASNGISITLNAFSLAIPGAGPYILLLCILIFSFTTMFSMSYYGAKCWSFLAGAQNKHVYNFFYVGSIILASVASLDAVIGLIDGMYAMMAIPTMVSALLLAPKVRQATVDYFKRLNS
ncbi:MAG: alanine:cation symporter family protein [Bacteroidetes bacterium]|nr:MAG: alanine:cation symporter family protein [Bacteroidota bacterium]